jgi:hypothetical protein
VPLAAANKAAAAISSDAPLSPRSELLRKRAHVVREVYETEQRYVKDLHLVVNTFLKLISKSGILKEVDIDAIFRNISSIYELHKEILHNLEECVGAGIVKGGPFPAANASLAPVLINLSAYLKLYTAYCVPEDHQILTNRGFMSLDAYKARATADKELLVAGYDARARQIVYERGVLREFDARPRSLVELAGDGDSAHISLQVTDDHDLLCTNRYDDDDDDDDDVKCAFAKAQGQGGARRRRARRRASSWLAQKVAVPPHRRGDLRHAPSTSCWATRRHGRGAAARRRRFRAVLRVVWRVARVRLAER